MGRIELPLGDLEFPLLPLQHIRVATLRGLEPPHPGLEHQYPFQSGYRAMVSTNGIEPLTSSASTRRSTKLSYVDMR